MNSYKTIGKIVEEITEEKPTERLTTNNIYQNIRTKPHLRKKKSGQSHFF